MKKINVIFLAVIMMMACINKINANDIYVEENGLYGAYTSITAACAVAQSGDRILVFPRANNAYYVDYGTINLPANCKMLSAVPGQRFRDSLPSGNFRIANNCQLSMAEICFSAYGSTVYLDGISGWVSNCKIINANIISDGGNTSYVHIDNDSLIIGDILLNGGGRISGCYALDINLNSASLNNDTTFIVGNWIGQMILGGSSNNNYVYIANNYCAWGIPYLRLHTGGTGMNTIINNVFIDLPSSQNDGIIIYGNNSRLRIENNLFINPFTYFHTPTAVIYLNGTLSPDSRISYNYVNFNNSSSNYTFAYGFTPDTTNHFTSNTTIDSVGHLIVGSDAINGGDPSVNYLDLDLTRNDAGMYGGSFSMSNFNTPGIGNPRVLFMTAPRSVLTTQTTNISADGVAK